MQSPHLSTYGPDTPRGDMDTNVNEKDSLYLYDSDIVREPTK